MFMIFLWLRFARIWNVELLDAVSCTKRSKTSQVNSKHLPVQFTTTDVQAKVIK